MGLPGGAVVAGEAVVGGEVFAEFVDGFDLGRSVEFGGELADVVRGFVGGEVVEDLKLEFEDVAGGFFASFHAGLVVGVDVDEGGVESDGAFVEGDELADGVGGDFLDGDGDGGAAGFVEGLAGAEEEALEVVAWGGLGFDFEGGGGTGAA